MSFIQVSWYPYETTFGIFTIASDDTAITSIKFGNVPLSQGSMTHNRLIDMAAKQMEEYFSGKRKIFELPLFPRGTVFQKSVWNTLTKIPYGETRSYKQIAEKIGNPAASRAVGMANHKNPIPIIIPCHRVVGTNGELTGYAGGLDLKRKLLEIENYSNIFISSFATMNPYSQLL